MFQAPPTLLTPAEAAEMFQVAPQTVRSWADAGKLSAIRTLGGQRRYLRVEVEDLLRNKPQAPEDNQ